MINPNKDYKCNKIGSIVNKGGYLQVFKVQLVDGTQLWGFLDRCVNNPDRFKVGDRVRVTSVNWSITADCWCIASVTKVKQTRS